MGKPKAIGNSGTENVLRGTGVAVRRESVRLLKGLAVEKRKIGQTRRLLEKDQRSLRVLMGRDAYPGGNGGRNEALSEFHPPGFCFKKNGEPRTPRTIHESGTRKILPMDVVSGGIKIEGTPATNVICSDSSSLGEVLSTRGEVLALLSEIRNTSALVQDPKILLDAWGEGEEEDPKVYLKHYRKTLLRRLFAILEGCEEVDDLLQLKNTPGYLLEDDLDMNYSDMPEFRPEPVYSRTSKASGVVRDPTQVLFRHTSQPSSSEGGVDGEKSTGGLVGSRGTVRSNQHSLAGSGKHVSWGKGKKGTPGQKTLLQGIIKKLVSKIRLMDQMGQDLLEYKRKRPYVTSDHLWGPLIKLLERQSLFSSLTDTENLPKDVEDIIEEELTFIAPPSVQMSSGGISQVLNSTLSSVRTKRNVRCEACRQRVLSPLKKTVSFSSKVQRKRTKLIETVPELGQTWTLSVSRMDLVRLHHELHTDIVSSRMAAIASSSFLLPLTANP